MSRRKVRTVPTIFASRGITLIAPGLPASIEHRLTTAESIGLTLRDTIALRRGDDVRRDHHRIDREVRVRAVAALAFDRDA